MMSHCAWFIAQPPPSVASDRCRTLLPGWAPALLAWGGPGSCARVLLSCARRGCVRADGGGISSDTWKVNPGQIHHFCQQRPIYRSFLEPIY